MGRGGSMWWGTFAAMLLVAFARPAAASLTVLVGEPFGSFGTLMPTGHVSLYLDRVCADGPTRVRMCTPGEPQGVVIARLNAIGPLDWIASPVMDFLYGANDPAKVMTYAKASDVSDMQEIYRRQHLLELFPDETENSKSSDEWWETVGAAYIRKLWGYRLATTEEQDEQFVAMLNAQPNVHRYHLHRTNCADFVADAVNFYYPGAVKTNNVADLWLMTPKQVARGVWSYGMKHPEAGLKIIQIPQIPGELRRSRPLRGATDMLLKTKRYLLVELIIQPEAVAAMWVMYMERGRWQIGAQSEVATPMDILRMTQPAAIASTQ
jgi:hypothetical protein